MIGTQASGKSVCAKLLFYFNNFVWKILDVVENDQTKRDLDLNYLNTFEEYFPPDSWGNHDFSIRYEIANVFIEVRRKQDGRGKISISYSDFFKKKIDQLRSEKKKAEKSLPKYQVLIDKRLYLMRFLTNSLTELLSKSLCQEAAFEQLFIPAGRSFFAQLQSSIFSFLYSNNALDPFLMAFGSYYENIKSVSFRFRDRTDEKKDIKDEKKDIKDEMNRLIEKSLCGKHIHEKGKDFLVSLDGRRISVANSSSGQQETLPLTIILAQLIYLPSGKTVYIEEPEAHLFPNSQRSIIELIATVFNYEKDKLQFFITTHSPYVLTAINNLVQAGILYQNPDQDVLLQLQKIIPKYKAINAGDLSAYVLENNKCSSIICPETGLIDASIIDSVSDELAIEFDNLLNLA